MASVPIARRATAARRYSKASATPALHPLTFEGSLSCNERQTTVGLPGADQRIRAAKLCPRHHPAIENLI
jgi:hypothetical protein